MKILTIHSLANLAAILFLTPPAALGADDAPPPQGFVALFNGRDLNGWKIPEGDGGHWKVIGGVIDYDAESQATGDKSLWSQEEFAQSRYRLTSEIFERMLRRPDGIKILRILVTLLDRKIKAFAFPMNLMDHWLADYVERFLIGHFIRDLVLA